MLSLFTRKSCSRQSCCRIRATRSYTTDVNPAPRMWMQQSEMDAVIHRKWITASISDSCIAVIHRQTDPITIGRAIRSFQTECILLLKSFFIHACAAWRIRLLLSTWEKIANIAFCNIQTCSDCMNNKRHRIIRIPARKLRRVVNQPWLAVPEDISVAQTHGTRARKLN